MKSISNRILVCVLISVSVVFVGCFFYSVNNRTQFETERLKKDNIRACERLSHFAVNPILNHDLNLVKTYIGIEALNENIGCVQILNRRNQLYAGVVSLKGGVRAIAGNQLLVLHQDSIVRSIVHKGKVIGKVIVYPNKEPMQQLLKDLRLSLFMELIMFFLLVAIVLFFVLKRLVVKPLLVLKEWMSSIDTSESISEPKLSRCTEIDTIIKSVSQLTDRLSSSRKENTIKSDQISENESLITAIGANMPEGMFYRLITNDKGERKFVYLSGSFQKIYGHSPEEGMVDPFLVFDRVLRRDIQFLLAAEEESKKNLSTYRCDVRMVNPDGTIRFSKFVSTPKLMEDGSICWDGIELDITDLKKAQADLQQNQFLLRSITEGLPDLIFAKDLDGRYLFVNSAVAKFANKNPEELLGEISKDVFPSDIVNETMAIDLDIMKSGKAQTFEEQVSTSSGEVVFLTTKGAIKDEQGETVGLFGIARDITEMKRTEEALRVSQDKFEFAFNSSPNAILIQDELTGRYVETNFSNTKMFGYSQEDFLLKTPVEMNLYKDTDVREKVYEVLKAQGYVRNMEVIGRHKSGEDVHVLLSLERHYVDNKPFLYVNLQDVTERKQVELELQKLNLNKDRFISILGHDLRGPVNGIVGLLEFVRANVSDMQVEEIEGNIDLVYQSAKNTSKLLDEILLWATAQSGKMKFNPQNINFKVDCSGIIELLQSTANAKNIEIKLICEEFLEVYADKNMLDTVLRNLISNALKFTREGGKIVLLAEKTPEKTVISIADNGIGIDDGDIGKIFDKTQLFTSIGTNEEKGTGFGLKLCQEFIEKHGGEIWVESEVGKGTTFYFSLPNEI